PTTTIPSALPMGSSAQLRLRSSSSTCMPRRPPRKLPWDGILTAAYPSYSARIPTADEHVLPNGTAYMTDVGMTGPYDSVIGVKKELVINRFLTNMPSRWEAATGDVKLCAVVIDCDEATGKARSIERLMLKQ